MPVLIREHIGIPRSRTFGEYFVCLVIGSSSQELKHPGKTGRFRFILQLLPINLTDVVLTVFACTVIKCGGNAVHMDFFKAKAGSS